MKCQKSHSCQNSTHVSLVLKLLCFLLHLPSCKQNLNMWMRTLALEYLCISPGVVQPEGLCSLAEAPQGQGVQRTVLTALHLGVCPSAAVADGSVFLIPRGDPCMHSIYSAGRGMAENLLRVGGAGSQGVLVCLVPKPSR